MDDLWCVHVEGPDDVLAAPSKEAAEVRAAELNAYFARLLATDPHPYDPVMNAAVIPWEYGAESHAKSVLKWNEP